MCGGGQLIAPWADPAGTTNPRLALLVLPLVLPLLRLSLSFCMFLVIAVLVSAVLVLIPLVCMLVPVFITVVFVVILWMGLARPRDLILGVLLVGVEVRELVKLPGDGG